MGRLPRFKVGHPIRRTSTIVYHALAAHWRVPFDKAVEAVTRNFNRITKFTRHSLCSPRKEILPCVTEEMTAFIRF